MHDRLLTTLALAAALMVCACSKGGDAHEPGAPGPALTETAAAAAQPAALGEPAPGFTLADLDGRVVSLSDYRGKIVVLEWFNPDCPFVKYAHGEGGPLAEQPERRGDDGVVWLAINSGAPGLQGYGVDVNRDAAATWAIGYPVLIDESGDLGRLCGAKTTPHMFVVDSQGVLAYRGALDSAPLGESEGVDVVNYVDAALDAVLAGEPVATPETKSYGCSVKYGS